MILMKPVLANTALYHFNLLLSFWIWIRPSTCAIGTFKVMVITIFWILRIFLRAELAEVATKLWVATVTTKPSLCPKFNNLGKKKRKKKWSISEFKYQKKKDMSTDDNALNSSDASEAANLTISKCEYWIKEIVATNNPMNYIHQEIISSLLQISKHNNKHLRYHT